MKTRGGQKVFYSRVNEWHQNYEIIQQHDADCGASVFSLLGYTNWANSIYLALITPEGIDQSDFLQMLKMAYGKGLRWVTVINDDIYDILQDGEATAAFVQWENEDYGHYFVIIREHGELIVLDPQSGVMLALSEYLSDGEVGRMDIIYSPTTRDGNNLVTRDIINRVMQPSKEQQDAAMEDENYKQSDSMEGFGTKQSRARASVFDFPQAATAFPPARFQAAAMEDEPPDGTFSRTWFDDYKQAAAEPPARFGDYKQDAAMENGGRVRRSKRSKLHKKRTRRYK